MKSSKIKFLSLALVFVLQSTSRFSYGQLSTYPLKTWVGQLGANYDPDQKNLQTIKNQLLKADSTTAFAVFSSLKKAGPSSDHYFNARDLYVMAEYCLRSNPPSGRRHVHDFYEKALNEAYFTADNEFIAFVNWEYGMAMENLQEMELATTYLLSAAELSRKLLLQNIGDDWGNARLQFLGELLFHARLYKKSIQYTRQYIEQFRGKRGISAYSIMKAWNTLGQGYQKLGKLDSALYCYQHSAGMAAATNNEIWKGINAGFTGQIYFLQKQYDKAKPLLQYDYGINKDKDANIAGYSLHWLGRIDLEQGRLDSALWKLKSAVQILEHARGNDFQNQEYREAAYYATADAFRLRGPSDSFYRYFGLYLSLHDSLQKITVRSSVDLAEMRIENAKNFYAVQLLQQQKRTEKLNRNFIIAAILALSVIAILVLVKQKQHSEYRQQLALQQKAAAEAEAAAANEQLKLFSHHITDKTALVEKLQRQLQDREINAAQQQVLEELSNQTILTEADWLQFKQMFEKVHTGFFARLKEKTPDITVAEQRMAALTRLHFTNHQIASMLGISGDSVRKTRLRLRNRLDLSADANLEEVFAAI